MLPYLLNLVYSVLIALAMPIVIWKRWRTGKYRRGWKEKLFGDLPDLSSHPRPRVWFHAVSVGEVLQLRQIVERLQRARPEILPVITTTTETGYSVARDTFPACEVTFFPLDFTWSVRRGLRRIAPSAIVLVELELWPNFILAAARHQIPLALINGRLSSRSFRGYSRIRPLVSQLLRCFSLIAVQTDEYRDRFISLGANPATTRVTGSIKFDGVATNSDLPKTRELAEWMELTKGAPVIVAGSTQAPEEDYALRAFRILKRDDPALRLVLVPRHPERRDEILQLALRMGFSVRQRSTRQIHSQFPSSPQIELLDTVGELGACWGLATVAFVGGSFGSRGGQNMLEPAAFGKPVCVGPNTSNFRQIVELLQSHDAITTVHSAEEMQEFFAKMLRHPEVAAAQGERAREVVLRQQGATDQTISLLLECLGEAPAGSQCAA